MTLHIRAHFDGRVLVPDQPVDLPLNQPLELEVTAVAGDRNGAADAAIIEERRRRLRASSGVLPGPELSDAALRRDSMYDDRS